MMTLTEESDAFGTVGDVVFLTRSGLYETGE